MATGDDRRHGTVDRYGHRARSPFVIRTSDGSVARIGAFHPGRSATLASAIRVFGRPSSTKVLSDNTVGDASTTVPDRYSDAEFRGGRWWLVTAVSPFGDESEYPVVSAVVGSGRVSALAGWIGAAGE
jgi:hypothetical protein